MKMFYESIKKFPEQIHQFIITTHSILMFALSNPHLSIPSVGIVVVSTKSFRIGLTIYYMPECTDVYY